MTDGFWLLIIAKKDRFLRGYRSDDIYRYSPCVNAS